MSPAFGRIHFAAGRVVVYLIHPEYPTNAWTPASLSHVLSEILRAMNWWNLKNGGRVSFVLVNQGTVPVQINPVHLSLDEEDFYLEDAMQAFGCSAPCPFEAIDTMNRDLAEEYGGH